MRNPHLKSIKGYFEERLKDQKYRRLYQIERAKVALAQKIAGMREEKHLNQKELAAKMGVSQQFISQIETGEGKNLTLDTLTRLAGSLGHKVRISFPKSTGQSAQLEIV